MRRFLLITLLALAAAQAPPAQAQQVKQISPVARVTKMLQDMQEQCKKEKKQDEELFQKMDCWCKTNDKDKKAAVKQAREDIAQYQGQIEEATATIELATTHIDEANNTMEECKKSIASANAERKKQNEAFNAEHASLSKALDQLTRAIKSLSAPSKESFVQVQGIVSHVSRSFHNDKYTSKINGDLMSLLSAFPDSSLRGKVTALAQNPGYQSYNQRSGPIVGILKQMKDDMSEDNKEALDREANQKEAHGEFVATKRAQSEAARKKRMAANEQKAEAQIDLANAKNDLKNTSEQLDEDSKFLVDLGLKCTTYEDEYNTRQKTRSEEIMAIGEALSILTAESSRDVFQANNAIQFIQVHRRAYNKLVNSAYDLKSLTLMALSARVGARGPFDKVLKAMDKMLVLLDEEQKADDDKKAFCNKELRTNEVETTDTNNNHEDTTAAAEQAQSSIDELAGEIENLENEVTEMQKQLKIAGEERGKQNQFYQTEINTQRGTVSILTRVLKKLQAFYARQNSFVQQPAGTAEASYSTSGQSSGVMVMIQTIIKDAERAEREAIKDEQDAQNEYLKFVEESNQGIAERQASITNKSAEKGALEEKLADLNAQVSDLETQQAALKKTNRDLHHDCDFMLDNFDARKDRRAQEKDGIFGAKSVLSGAGDMAKKILASQGQ